MQCHNSDSNGFFSGASYFMPVEEVCPLEDNIPEAIKIQKKDNGITYLPGERLLIQLSKQRKKNKKNNNIDVARVTASLGRLLR
jgi:hypothetical protein